MKNTSRLPSPALILAIVALVLALTGSAVAAKRYLITNTKQISPVVLKQLAKLAAVQGAQGPAGAPGAAGATGAAGAAGEDGAAGPVGAEGATGKDGAAGEEGAPGKEGPRSDVLWAVVEPGGVVARASEPGVVAEENTPGFSIVRFPNHPEPITDCAYEATIGLASQSQTAFPGYINVVRLSSDERAVYVQTYNPKEASVPLGYHLAVFC